MGKFMKFLYGIMLIVLAVLAAGFIAIGSGEKYLIDTLFYYIKDPFYRNFVLAIGVILLIFALIILIVLIKNRNRGFDVLIEDEKGTVLITKKSLKSALASSVSRIYSCEPIKSKAVIVDGEKIEAKLVVDYYSDEKASTLSERIRNEASKTLSELTGISDIKLDLKLDKKEKQREIRANGQY